MKEKNQITASTLIHRALATQNQTNKPSSNQESKAYDDTENSNQSNHYFKNLLTMFSIFTNPHPPITGLHEIKQPDEYNDDTPTPSTPTASI